MEKENKYKLNNPLPYIFISFIIGSYIYKLYYYDFYKLLAVFFACSFIYLVYKIKSKEMAIVVILFIILAISNNLIYYNYNPNNEVEIRISKIDSGFIIGNINNRKIYVEIENENLIKEGDLISALGNFKSDINTQYGTIGSYKIKEYVLVKEDLISFLSKVRLTLFENIKEKIGRRKASFITSLAFGYKEHLDIQDKEQMNDFGVSHAIAVSGLHMAIVFGLLKKVSNYKIALILSFFYVLFTGGSSSTIRAYIMIFIMTLGPLLQKNYNSTTALSLAGLIILILRPYDIFSLGFSLSFLATLGIIIFNGKLNKKLYRLPSKIREVISISLSAQVFTFPVIAFVFKEFSFNFIVGNLVILPFLNFLVILGNLLIITMKLDVIFNYIVYLCYLIIRLIDLIIDFLWRFKLDKLYIGSEVGYFYCILLITAYFYNKKFKNIIYFPIAIILFIGLSSYNFYPSIKYYEEGGLLISYKGERGIIITKNLVDKVKLKKITKGEILNFEDNSITISDIGSISKKGNSYILQCDNYEYVLKVNNKQIDDEYDIIDFKSGNLKEVILLEDKILVRK